MDIITRKEDTTTILEVSGKIDTLSSQDFQKALFDPINQGDTHIILDFKQLRFMSSAGLRVLIMAQKRLSPHNGSLLIAHLSASIREVFDVAGFSQLFKLFDTTDDALSSL